ncbi:glycine cleavage system protein GcvH [Streptomyces sp. SID486]|uniref:glycine cleavage system protein GcvH n=1 Tax=unclassified Streptomyces TaxID=2593676 RepID=UPI00136C3AEB|nr:glycine cleavage system protein GcvH [Streptomyces sp. SID486]MYX97019.1 glycine cleavage system protein GcvH [Streptomyces sp. SID486]
MATPEDLKYTKDHEWVRITGDKAYVGITDHAQKQLGDVVFVELPEAGAKFDAGQPFGSLESVKAVSEVYMPLSGTVSEPNAALNDDPELVNTDPYGEGWMVAITLTDRRQLAGLLSAAQYEDYIRQEAD